MALYGVFLLWFCRLMFINGQATPTTNCPEFVPEYQSVTCTCHAPNNMQRRGMTVEWLGRSLHALLSLTNVQRGDNGSSFTCLVTSAGRTLYTQYTLRVAYGPSNEHLTLGQADLITNGSQSLSLTCNATDVYPTPDYHWYGVTCDNGTADNVCVFTPDPTTDDLSDVTCTAVGSYGDWMYWPNLQQASKTIQLKLSYPPAQKPVIEQQTKEPQFLQIGDNLTCIVTGGKPLVDSVQFYCTNPNLPDEEDARSASSVSSSVTVNTIAGITDTHTTCYCNATWGTKAEYYTLASSAVYFFKPIPPVTSVTEALNMTEEGISFTVEAYPVPDTFNFTYRGNHLPNNGSYVSSDGFSSVCKQAPKTVFLVNCTVTPLNYSELLPGFYTVSVSNDFGHADISFLIESEGILDDQDPTGIIVGGSGMLLLAVFVVIVVFLQRQRYKRKKNRWRRRKNGYDRILGRATTDIPNVTSFHETAALTPRAMSAEPDGSVTDVRSIEASSSRLQPIHRSTERAFGPSDVMQPSDVRNGVTTAAVHVQPKRLLNQETGKSKQETHEVVKHNDTLSTGDLNNPVNSEDGTSQVTFAGLLEGEVIRTDNEGQYSNCPEEGIYANSTGFSPSPDKIVGPKGDLYTQVIPKSQRSIPSLTREDDGGETSGKAAMPRWRKTEVADTATAEDDVYDHLCHGRRHPAPCQDPVYSHVTTRL